MKPRVMSLVIFTCAVGFLTSNSNTNIIDAMTGIILVALGAGAAGCLNMWYESDLDALMTRTCLRPIPTGKINRKQALIFGVLLTVFSVGALNYFSNFLSASLLLFTIFFYLFVYTIWLKRKTPQNIVIGGIAGSLPPVIGWAIATNSISLESSLYKIDDYKKAKIPMLPLTDGIERTKLYIFIYSLLMLPVIILPYIINFSGLVYLIPAMMFTIYYNFMCYNLYRHKKNKFTLKQAKKVFGYSILYLFLIFLLFLIDNSI
jgi:protoheme IX farnesyltransferase